MVTKPEPNRGPLGCGGKGKSHHGQICVKIVDWSCYVNMDQNLWAKFPALQLTKLNKLLVKLHIIGQIIAVANIHPSIQYDLTECAVRAIFPSLSALSFGVVWNIKAKLRPSIFYTAFCKQQMNELYRESGHNLCISVSPWPISLLFWMGSGVGDGWCLWRPTTYVNMRV